LLKQHVLDGRMKIKYSGEEMKTQRAQKSLINC